MEISSSQKHQSSHNKPQSSYFSSLNSTKTKIKVHPNHTFKHYQTATSLQQQPTINHLKPCNSSQIDTPKPLFDIRFKLMKQYLTKNHELDRKILLMILQPEQFNNQCQFQEKALLKQLGYKIRCLIEQNKKLRMQYFDQGKMKKIVQQIQKIKCIMVDRLQEQQNMIDSLSMKLDSLEGVKQYLEQLHFQKIVKFQQSSPKTKIQITKCPPSLGQTTTISTQVFNFSAEQTSNIFTTSSVQINNHNNNSTNINEVNGLYEQIGDLSKKNEQLREQLQLMMEGLDNQREIRIREIGQKEELQLKIQKLKAQRIQMQFSLNKVREELKQSSLKLQQYQTNPSIVQQNLNPQLKPINPQQHPSHLLSQLKSIKSILIKCNKSSMHSLQSQIIQLIQQRNQFRRQYLKLKSKVSHGEIKGDSKLLQDRNVELQQKCCFYEKEIERYQQILREINEEKENVVYENIMKDFIEMNSNSGDSGSVSSHNNKDDLGLKHSRTAQNCIINTINRIDQLEKIIMKQ